jgi:hypothetical protein
MAGFSKRKLFKNYAVLGDDIVIWDKPVADNYLKIITGLGVEVGLAKSVISLKGDSVEFAKRTLKGGEDVSPIPLKEYAAALDKSASLVSFVKKYNCTPGAEKSMLGIGYKSSELSLRWQMWSLVKLYPVQWSDVSTLFRGFHPNIGSVAGLKYLETK